MMILEVPFSISTSKKPITTPSSHLRMENKDTNLLMSWDARAPWFSRRGCKTPQPVEKSIAKRFLKSMNNTFQLKEVSRLIFVRKRTETMLTIIIEATYQNSRTSVKCFLGLSFLKCIENHLRTTVNFDQSNVSNNPWPCTLPQMTT